MLWKTSKRGKRGLAEAAPETEAAHVSHCNFQTFLKPAALFIVLASGSVAFQSSPTDRVQQILERAEGKEANEWAQLLMKADAEATKLEKHSPGGCCGYRCVRIHEYQLTFTWDDIADGETYQHDLLKTVVHARRGTEPGAQALTRLLQPGCGGVLANEWTPYFKTVLDIVDSRLWRKVNDLGLTRIRAEAYETWWSLSKASADEPPLRDNDLQPADFERGAEEARRQAIVAYQDWIAKAPRDQEALDRLHKLEAGKDTHQRQWYCFGD